MLRAHPEKTLKGLKRSKLLNSFGLSSHHLKGRNLLSTVKVAAPAVLVALTVMTSRSF